MRLALATVLALLAAPAFADSAIPLHQMIAGSIDDFARPKFAAFAASTSNLKSDIAALCATPSETTLHSAQDAFKSTVLAFSTIEFVQMGPLGAVDRLQRLLFWPDVKGIALRQVQTTLAAKDPTAADAVTLKDKSVAVQGLGAVEFLLFGTGNDDLASATGAYRCRFAAAASALIDGIAQTLSTEWASTAAGGPADVMLNPTPTSTDYRTELEVINKLAGVLTLGIDTIRDQRLSPILSFSTGVPKPRAALFWRSGMTAPALGANFAGLRDFFHAAKFSAALVGTSGWIASGADFEFTNDIKSAAAVTGPLDQAVADPEGLLNLKQMYVSTGSLDTLLGDNLGAALGLSSGFSQLDGD